MDFISEIGYHRISHSPKTTERCGKRTTKALLMKVLVIGAAGQLGTELCRVFADCTVYRADRSGPDVRLDVRDAAAVHKMIAEELAPDLVINTAAAHNVPLCEEQP